MSAAPYFEEQGIEHVLLSVDEEVGPFSGELSSKFEIMHMPIRKGPWGISQIRRAAKDSRADVIHCHSEAKGMAAAIAGAMSSTPVVRTYHSIWPSSNLKHRVRRRIEALLCARIAVGASVQATEMRWGPVQVITNWVEGRWSKSHRDPSSPIKLVTVCNTSAIKRCDLMIELVSKHEELDLTHIGFDSLGIFGAQNGLKDRIRSIGPRNDVLDQLGTFDCYVCTSSLEGFGLALMEAGLSGLPLAIVDAPGVRDMLEYFPETFMIDLKSDRPFFGLLESIKKQAPFYERELPKLADKFSPSRGAQEYSVLYKSLCRP